MDSHPLTTLFYPRTIAVIGATEEPNTVGQAVFSNLIHTFRGAVYPVNPKRATVLNLKAYPSVKEIPEPIDLAVIVTKAESVPEIIDACASAGVSSVIVISSGFKEVGAKELEEEVIFRARKGNIRLLGPNCLGIMNPHIQMNATFAAQMALKGSTAFLSQSGALCTAVLDWSLREKIGFSTFVSLGSMADIDWGDLLDFLAHDPHTESILIYMETIGKASSFLKSARSLASKKPLVVIKPGRTQAAAQAALSHTGSLTGADAVFDAAMEQAGVLRVDTIEEMFDIAQLLRQKRKLKGPNLAILTNAGGPAVLAADATVLSGALLAELSSETLQQLNTFLPKAWSHHNPVDILGDALEDRYQKALTTIIKDPKVDGILVILTPQAMTQSTATAKAMTCVQSDKPILASWMGADFVKEGIDILNLANIATYRFPDSASRAFGALWKQTQRIKFVEEPSPKEEDVSWIKQIEEKLFSYRERTLLTEVESKEILALAGIPVVRTEVAKTEDQAGTLAESIGFPVVLKLHSQTVTHKSDVGGVKLNLRNPTEVVEAFRSIAQTSPPGSFEGVSVQSMIQKKGIELLLGSTLDPQFGPVIVFGSGGEFVEIYQDRALAMPPLTPSFAEELIKRTKISGALNGFRGRDPVNVAALKAVLIRFSTLMSLCPQIMECDVNPLIATSQGVIVLDARIVLKHD